MAHSSLDIYLLLQYTYLREGFSGPVGVENPEKKP